MKKLFVSLMTALLIGTSSITFATPAKETLPVEASVIVRPQTLKLDVITPANDHASVVIRLRDDRGNTLLTKHISKSERATLSRFDLSNLNDGKYEVEISNGSGKQVKTFTIQTTPPSFTSLRSVSLS